MWISIEGCYWNTGNSPCHHNLSEKNGPHNCFNACQSSTYVGLKENCCMCDVRPGNYSSARNCNFTCRGEDKMYCGSRNTTSVYLKAWPQPNISIYGEYGYAFVHISGDIRYPSYVFYAAVNASEKHKYFCSDGYPFDGHSRCSSSNGKEKSWLEARDECFLLHNQILAPYHLSYNSSLCFPQAQNGDYWIGMIWSRPESTTTISTTSMKSTMMTRTTSMTPFITTKLTNTMMIASIAPPLLTATSHTTATIAAVAVIISVVLIAIVVSVVICYKKEKMCFKHRRNSVGVDDFSKITIPSTAVPSIPPGSTLAPSIIHH